MTKLCMGPTVRVRSAALRLGPLLLALAAALPGRAATLSVSVVDEQGRPIENVAVYALPAEGAAAAATSTPMASMDQQGLEFVPHLLVVQAGTSVTFPNSDDVSHHVYSFSATKKFELALYKGDVYPPVVFDDAGIVVLGCNIHDGMLGYVVVVDTPYFATTNERGIASLGNVPGGSYAVSAWTPRVRPSGLPPAQHAAVTESGGALEIRIMGRLAPAHAHGASSLTWDRY
jgi:plastocyanin